MPAAGGTGPDAAPDIKKDQMYQHTLKREYEFEGKGLHTGKISRIIVGPAPEGTGIRFRKSVSGVEIDAVAENVTSTSRCTTISSGNENILTIEHIMSALTGMGIDNASIVVDGDEIPILDGSARLYVEAFSADGTVAQNAEREYITVPSPIEVHDEKSGSWVRIEPADRLSYDVTVDFGSKVLGVQTAHWDEDMDYAREIGFCRTFVFFHEIEYLMQNNLIKGGDVDNAIVVVEYPVTDEQLERMEAAIDRKGLSVVDGYLNNLALRYPNECGRHKLLDLIGDMRLCGGYLKARITAYKPGHGINTTAAKAFRESLKNK